MWVFEPTGPEELNELLHLYMDIGNMNTEQNPNMGSDSLSIQWWIYSELNEETIEV